jgi:hypothetical protein
MASVNKSKPAPKPFSPFDDDDKWDIVVEKDEKDITLAPKPASPPSAVSPPNTSFGMPPPPTAGRPLPNPQPPYFPGFNPMMQPQPRSPFSVLPGDNVITYPTRQMALEAQLMQLAEVDLGLLNAADILEKHLLGKKLVEGSYEIFITTNINNPGQVVQSPANRNHCYSNERQNSTTVVRDMAYLMGLERAVKILRDAHEDRSRKNATYSIKIIGFGPPPSPPPPLPQSLMVQTSFPQTTINEDHFCTVVREVVKDTLKDCKDDSFTKSSEEVQKEMIKLCRDVCRDALAKKE